MTSVSVRYVTAFLAGVRWRFNGISADVSFSAAPLRPVPQRWVTGFSAKFRLHFTRIGTESCNMSFLFCNESHLSIRATPPANPIPPVQHLRTMSQTWCPSLWTVIACVPAAAVLPPTDNNDTACQPLFRRPAYQGNIRAVLFDSRRTRPFKNIWLIHSRRVSPIAGLSPL